MKLSYEEYLGQAIKKIDDELKSFETGNKKIKSERIFKLYKERANLIDNLYIYRVYLFEENLKFN